jgi:hypothetical protein
MFHNRPNPYSGQHPYFPQQAQGGFFGPSQSQFGPTRGFPNPTRGNFITNLLSGAKSGSPVGPGIGGFGVSNIQGMLNNVQGALKVAQTVGPMVQQYGPLVKNIPAVISIFKEMNSSDTSSDAKKQKSKSKSNSSKSRKKNSSKTNSSTKINDTAKKTENRQLPNRSKRSTPKLYLS